MFGDATGAHMEEDLNIEGNDRNSDSYSGDDDDESDEDTESDAPHDIEKEEELPDMDEARLESTLNHLNNGGQIEEANQLPAIVLPQHGPHRGSLNEKRAANNTGPNLFVPTQGNDGSGTHPLGSHRPSVNEALNFQNEHSDFGRTGTFLFGGFNNANIL